jgi:hypothetical protein
VLKFEVLGGFDSYNFDYSRDFAFVQIGADRPRICTVLVQFPTAKVFAEHRSDFSASVRF